MSMDEDGAVSRCGKNGALGLKTLNKNLEIRLDADGAQLTFHGTCDGDGQPQAVIGILPV